MQKYIVTVMVNGEEFPIKMRGKSVEEVQKEANKLTHIDKVVSIVSKDIYSSPYKVSFIGTSSLTTNVRTTGSLSRGQRVNN